MTLRPLLTTLLPGPDTLSHKDKLKAAAGALLGIGLTALWAWYARADLNLPWWLFAPLGASAAQVFSVPGSPMSQPWNVVAGHVVSAACGMLSIWCLGQSALSAGVGVGLAVLAMLYLRCLHPSGGGTALLVVVLAVRDPLFLLFPVAATSLSLVCLTVLWHHLTCGVYPLRQRPAAGPLRSGLMRLTASDLEAALSTQSQALAMSREDLESLIALTERHALNRMAEGLTCADLMSADPVTTGPSLSVRTAKATLQRHDIKALPVVDASRRLLGLYSAGNDGGPLVSHAMKTDVAQISGDAPASELIPILTQPGRHHVVVVDAQGRVMGIIARSDLMRALMHHATNT